MKERGWMRSFILHPSSFLLEEEGSLHFSGHFRTSALTSGFILFYLAQQLIM